MEGVLDMQMFRNAVLGRIVLGPGSVKQSTIRNHQYQFPSFQSRIRADFEEIRCLTFDGLTDMKRKSRTNGFKICAVRSRKRADLSTGTYVLLEPGEDEVFVTEEELRSRLKVWLENWPAKSLPPDLSRFESVDDAVHFLVNFVCELEIDGDVGSIQWYQVRLE